MDVSFDNGKKTYRKVIIIILIFLLITLLGIGFYSFFSFNQKTSSITSISVSEGQLYPSYSPDVNEYQVYTDSDEITINCDALGENIKGCNEKVTVNNKVSDYEITTTEKGKEVKYVIKIIKQDTNYSEIVKINNIEGVPNSWVKSTTIKINVENDKNIEGIKYSFDGGKTWRDNNSLEVNNNTTLQILAKDYFGYVTKEQSVTIDKIDNDKPIVALSKKGLGNGKVLLTATATDEGSLVSGYNWNNKGYGSSNILEVDKAGVYSVIVNDKVGNESDKVSIQVGEDDLKDNNQKEFVAVFDNNGADDISEKSLKCSTKGDSCVVKAPNISRKNYNILGWSTNSNATSAEIKSGSDIKLTKDQKYYAITSKKVSAIFNKNGATSIGADRLSCNIYNSQTSCSVISPSIKRDNYNVMGWSLNKDAKGSEVKVGEKITLSEEKVFYAITYSKITVTFNKNGSNSIGSSSLPCYKYNNQTTCTVNLPTIKASSGFEVVGWGSSASSTNKVASPGQKVTLNKNTTYYAVTKSINPYKITFNKNGANNISFTSQSCYRYNGSPSCIVTTPTITPSSGFEVVGWGNSASSITKVASINQKISLNKNMTYYAVTRSNNYYTVTFNKNGASGIGASSSNCYRYNGNSSCTIVLPTIKASSGFEVVGWGNSSSSTNKEASVGQRVSLNKNTTYYAVTKSINPYKATFNNNGSRSIGANSQSCYRYNGSISCVVTTPTITPSSGFELVGWGNSSSSISKVVSPGAKVSLIKDANYYAVTKSKDYYTVTFNKNGASSIGASSSNCYRYNGNSSCTIVLPTIKASSGFEVVGWGSSASSTNKVASTGQTVSLNKNTTYYAVTKSTNPYTVTFWPRSASIGSYSKGTGIKSSCYRYNNQSNCSVTTPSVNLSSKQQFLGWSTNQNATSSNIKNNQSVSVGSNTTYYAIVKETLTATFNKNGADSLSFYSTNCISYGDGCVITNAPHIYKKGYETWGGFSFGSPSANASGVINNKITSDTNLYVKWNNWNGHPASTSIATTYTINGLSIDVEKSNDLPYSVYNKYYNLLKDSVYKNMPYLFDYKGKVRMLSNYSYANKYWSGSSAGITYGYGNEYNNIDINLGNSYSEYSLGCFVHELAHAFDSYYRVKTGTLLRNQPDILKLYNKYKNKAAKDRPLRDYSYSNNGEFVADLFAYYYYYKYRTNVTNPKGGNAISKDKEFVTVIEKYIKIAKNGYK